MMAQLSKILRSVSENRLAFHCPGCDEIHVISVGGSFPWAWNGDAEKPTFSPSILVTSGHYIGIDNGDGCWCTFYKEHPPKPGEKQFQCVRCHSYVKDGQIEFLGDCTHALVGKTVSLPDFE